MENKMLDNIANLLAPHRGATVQVYSDVFQQDLNDKITNAYDSIAKANGNVKKSDLAVAAGKLGKKYDSLAALVKSGRSKEEVLASPEYHELSANCATDAEQFLDAQITSINGFLCSAEVQTKVAEDFDAGNYKSFDVNHGDNNCQSRIFLMSFFQQSKPYAELDSYERLMVTLCHITCQYKREDRDIFEILVKDRDNGNVTYGKYKLSSLKADYKLNGIQPNKFYTPSDLVGQAVSIFSAGYMIAVANTLNDPLLRHDLKPYFRQTETGSKSRSAQQMQAPGILAMYRCIEHKQLPFIYRVTRVTTTTLASGEPGFKFQGAEVVDSMGNPVRTGTTEPTIVCELYSVDTPGVRKRAASTKLATVANADSFDSYLGELKSYGIQRLVQQCLVSLDNNLLKKEVAYASPELMQDARITTSLESCLSRAYTEDGANRSWDGAVLVPCHVYVNSTQNEVAKVMALRERSPEAGVRI